MNNVSTFIEVIFLIVAASAAPEGDQAPYGPPPAPYGPDPRPYRPAPQPYEPVQYKPVPSKYKPAPIKYKPAPVYKEEEETYAPQPYKYEYGVQDDYTNAAFAKSESQNEVGTVTGSYKVSISKLNVLHI